MLWSWQMQKAVVGGRYREVRTQISAYIAALSCLSLGKQAWADYGVVGRGCTWLEEVALGGSQEMGAAARDLGSSLI